MSPRPSKPRPPAARHGFTLLELIISVALVLVLMLAITRIFTITSDAVGASQGLAAATRDARAAQAVFARDIGAMASDSPFIWIRCREAFSAFRNATDDLADIDRLELTIDLNNDGREGDSAVAGEIVQGHLLNSRRHRFDNFSFFMRDRFVRQTGNTAGNVFVSGLTSPEAWVYYGDVALPNNNGTFAKGSGGLTNPGEGTGLSDNPNNYYASQWVLGRFSPLMLRRSTTTNDIREGTVVQEFFTQISGDRMRPFTSGTPATVNPTVNKLPKARYDLIDVDMTLANDIVDSARVNAGTPWYQMILDERLQINPFVTKPISSAALSQQASLFVNSVSQFVVEFAGDFITQDFTGALTDAVPDGTIDFSTNRGVRQIRWYGYPRDTDGDGTIDVQERDTDSDGVIDTVGADVVPISNIILADGVNYSTGTHAYRNVEHFRPNDSQPSRKTYTATPAFSFYYAAWGPDTINNPDIPRPRMYRITMTIDRPEMAGRTLDGVSFEYVFNAP